MKFKNKICIGTPQFSGLYGITNKSKKKLNLKEINNFFKILKKKKVDFLDTALSYKKAEKNIFLSKVNTSKFKIITKIPRPLKKKNYENKIMKEIINSKNKFKIKSFYAILLHDSRNLNNDEIKKISNTFNILKKRKLARYIGFSIYNKKQYRTIIKYFNPDIIQVPANIFDRTFLTDSFLKEIKKKKIKLHCRSIFLQGIVLSNIKFIKKKFKKWEKIFNKWENFCKLKKYSKIELATNFILNYPLIDKIVVGFHNKNELSEFLQIKKIHTKLPNFINKNDKSIEKLIKPYNWN